MRVLLVEDEPSASRLLAKGLREQAYLVDVANTGDDIVVLDVMLPGQDLS